MLERPTNLTTNGGDVLDDTASLEFTHGLHGLASDVHQTEVVDLHLLSDLLFRKSLEWSTESVSDNELSN